MAKESYDHQKIEKDAQEKWTALDIHTTDLQNTEKDPYYFLFEFPYPSGDLHTGHWYAFAMPDIYARYLRMKGKNVLFPVGFDAFGLPAENAAIKNSVNPKEWTYANMDRMRSQLRSMGGSFDWSKEVITCEPEYYKWTQWLFAKLYEHGLAVRKEAGVKWCPHDQTVLANEQVINGTCSRCGHEVEERILTQWFLSITKYAKRLLEDLDPLPWREEIKDAQRAWIGESEGARLYFKLGADLNDDAGSIEVFTTRPDTIFGATYVVLAPEHPLVATLLPLVTNTSAVEEYRLVTSRKTERERSENKDKTGVQLEGIWAVNPATEQEIPVYLADYVIASYGTGAVMAVPAHDERDYEFAKQFNLPIRSVIEPLFIKQSGSDAVRKDEPMVERKAAVAVIKHWEKDEYLVLKWKMNDWCGFVVGGIEEGEDPIDTAKREIHEETGYKNATYIRLASERIHTQFYHEVKKQNRYGHFDTYYFELENGDRDEMAEEEKNLHEVVWVPKDDVAAMLAGDVDMAYIWNRAIEAVGAYTGDGLLQNSANFSGKPNREVMGDIVEAVGGERITNYRIRDWLVSRQRYWGCPIPVVYDPEGTAHLIPPEHLPWLLPTDIDFSTLKDTGGKSPLAQSKELKDRVETIFGEGWTPEYDTLDTFVDSSWYFNRYLSPNNAAEFSDPKLMKKWLPVNRYSGGSEHTTLHLLYARFFQKALFDLALVPNSEPFAERFNRGLIMGPDGQKMSKSKGNVINPDEYVKKYGADALRIYLAFIGPYNEPGHYPWNLDGIEAMRRFLDRVVRLADKVSDEEPTPEIQKVMNKAIHKVGEDIERFKFNTALSALMIALNEFEKHSSVPRKGYRDFLKLLAPIAPHVTDYLFEKMEGLEAENVHSIHQTTWPEASEMAADEMVTVVVQINGKRKGDILISPDAPEDEALTAAKELANVAQQLANITPQRIIYVPGRIINVVV